MDLELDLSFLTIEERQTILGVLKRDEELRQAEQARKKALKMEITQLRQQSAIRVGTQQKTRQCIRCHEELGLLFNKGEVCCKCKHKVCPNCRVTCSESSAFSWLCSLCYKQRLLPAVAGDWFYEKIDKKYEMGATFGSEVVRSSIRKLSAPFANGVTKENGTRSNPFTTEPAGSTSTEKSKEERGGVGYINASARRTIRKVTSRTTGSSSSSSSDEELEEKPVQKTTTLNKKLSSDTSSVDESRGGMSSLMVDNCSRLASKSDPALNRNSLSSSKEILKSAHSLDPADLLSGVGLRVRSKSAFEPSSRSLQDCDSDCTVEELTQIKFRRCSVLLPNEDVNTNTIDTDGTRTADDQSAASNGLGSGSLHCSNGGVINVALSHTNPNIITGQMSKSQLAFFNSDINSNCSDNMADIPAKKISDISPMTRRRIPLTPELDRKSPMIGRRELDISEQFLKSFSDSSSDESDSSLDDGQIYMGNAQVLTHHVPLRPRLSMIKEDSLEDTTNSPHRTKSKETSKLKLIIRPDLSDGHLPSRLDGGTPVTPDKYSDNWNELALDRSQELPAHTSMTSWNSDTISLDLSGRDGGESTLLDDSSDEEMDEDEGHFHTQSIISPKPATKKIDRSAQRKKKSQTNSSSFNPASDFSVAVENPSSNPNPFFFFPNPDSAVVPYNPSSETLGSIDSYAATPHAATPPAATPLAAAILAAAPISAAPVAAAPLATTPLAAAILAAAPISAAPLAVAPVAAKPLAAALLAAAPLALLTGTGSLSSNPRNSQLHASDISSTDGISVKLLMEDGKSLTSQDIRLADSKAVKEVDEVDRRLSPDGCSPRSSKDDIQIVPETDSSAVKALITSVPILSVADGRLNEVTIVPSDMECRDKATVEGKETQEKVEIKTPDVFEEEDIDDIFKEAKKAKIAVPRISSHLSVSTESLHSSFTEADYNKHEISGELQFSVGYEKSTGVLTVGVHQCRGLTAVIKKKNTSDPYVKSYLVAGNQRVSKRKTKVVKATLNPQFDETFRYTLSETQLLFRTLQLSVWSFHRIGGGDFLGEVCLPLDSFIFNEEGGQSRWYPLAQKVVKVPESPRLHLPTEFSVALQFVPAQKAQSKGSKSTKAELQVKVHSARNLLYKKSGTCDSYVKCVLLPDKIKYKTNIVRDTLNPVWDETFSFPKKSTTALEECALELTIWDHDKLGYHDLLGAVRFSLGKGMSNKKKVDWMDASGKQKEIWETMINNPSNWIEHSFVIKRHVPIADKPEHKEVVKKLEMIEQE